VLPKPCIGREFAEERISRNPGKNGQRKGNGRLTTPHFGNRNQVPGNRLRVRIPCPPLSTTSSHAKTCVAFFLRRPATFQAQKCSQSRVFDPVDATGQPRMVVDGSFGDGPGRGQAAVDAGRRGYVL
jgi:hypothetical protein